MPRQFLHKYQGMGNSIIDQITDTKKPHLWRLSFRISQFLGGLLTLQFIPVLYGGKQTWILFKPLL